MFVRAWSGRTKNPKLSKPEPCVHHFLDAKVYFKVHWSRALRENEEAASGLRAHRRRRSLCRNNSYKKIEGAEVLKLTGLCDEVLGLGFG